MNIDLKKFKKISSDGVSTTLQHPDGHQIKVAHSALSAKLRGKLAELPVHRAEGSPEPEMSQASAAELPQTVSPEPQGNVAVQINPNQAPPQEAPKENPNQARLRQLYNINVARKAPVIPGTGDIDPMANLDSMWGSGPNEKPKDFDADAWKQAESQLGEEQQTQQNVTQQRAEAIAQQNEVRARAGLPPLPMPQGMPQPPAQAQNVPAQAGGPTQEQKQSNQGYDPYGNEAYYQAYGKGLQEQKSGIFGQAAAEGKLAAAEGAAATAAAEKQQAAMDAYSSNMKELQDHMQAAIKDYSAGHINPNHYLENMDAGKKVRTAIGLILGGMGAGLTHSDNLAMKFLNDQINRDVAAQQAELGKKANLITANYHLMGNMTDATKMTQAMQMQMYAFDLKKAAAQIADPMAKARALQAAGQLDMQAAPVLSQIAMRRTMLQGMSQGNIDPSTVVRMIVPEKQQEAAYKELQDAQNQTKAKATALSSFDQLSHLATAGNYVTSPLQTSRQVAAIRDPLMAELGKEFAGKFTETDFGIMRTLFPAVGDDQNTLQRKRAQLEKMVSEKMNYPILQAHGISMNQIGRGSRYNEQGQRKITLGEPIASR